MTQKKSASLCERLKAQIAWDVQSQAVSLIDLENLWTEWFDSGLSSVRAIQEIVFGAFRSHLMPHILSLHRDCSFLLTRAKRARLDTCELEELMLKIASKCDEPPRDNLYSYACRNPARQRRLFTGLDAEENFVSAISDASFSLYQICVKLLDCFNDSGLRKTALVFAVEQFEIVIDAIIKVIKSVPPDTFVFKIQPWFERFTVADTTFHGPTASQLPLVALESILYGSRTPRRMREHIDFQMRYLPGVLTSICGSFKHYDAVRFWESQSEYRVLKRRIFEFRKIHLSLAEKAFALQPHASGFASELLRELLSESRLLTESS